MIRKTVFLVFTAFILVSPLIAQGPPEVPHRVYGNITDEASGEPVEVDVSMRNDDTVASGTSSSDGFYDLRFTASEGEEFFLFAQDTNTSESINYESGASQDIDYAGDFDTSSNPVDPPEDDNETEEDPEDGQGDDSDQEDDSGGSGGSGGGGGGGLPPGFGLDNDTQNDSENDTGEDDNSDGGSLAPPNTKNFDVALDGYTNVDIGDLKQNQPVVVSIDNGVTLRGLEFTAGERASDVSLTLADSSQPLSGVSIDSGEAFAYIDMEASGINRVYNTDISFKVPSTWVDSRDRQPAEISIARYSGGWNDRDSSYASRDIGNYIFSSDFAPGDYAVYMPEEQEDPSIEVQSLEVEKNENSSDMKVTARITNSGTGSGEKTIPLYANGEKIDERTVSLNPGESMSYTFDTEVSEETTFSMGGQERVVEAQSQSSILTYLIIAGVVIALIVLVAVVKYISEQRQARRMEREIAGIRNREQKVENEMKSLLQSVEDLRKKID